MSIITFKEKQIVIDESWISFFEENQGELSLIESKIGNNFTPKPEDIFKIFLLPKDQIKTVIIGQDPYPQEGVATGRCFEVLDSNWSNVNPSLKVILQSFYYHSTGKVMSFESILEKIKIEEWQFYPPNQLFEILEKKSGVFLLNKTLTCEIGKRNSHDGVWDLFVSNLIQEISDIKIHWLLWGNVAQSISQDIKHREHIIKTVHPVAYMYRNEMFKLEAFIKNSGLNLIGKF